MIKLISKKKFLDDYMNKHGFRYPLTYKASDYNMEITRKCFRDGIKEYKKFTKYYLNKS